jgi:hypothetical protein
VTPRKPKKSIRAGWADEAKAIGQSSDEVLVLGEFSNKLDQDWEWLVSRLMLTRKNLSNRIRGFLRFFLGS